MTNTFTTWQVTWLTNGQAESFDTVDLPMFPKSDQIIGALNTIAAEPFDLNNCDVYGENGAWYVDYDNDYSVRLDRID